MLHPSAPPGSSPVANVPSIEKALLGVTTSQYVVLATRSMPSLGAGKLTTAGVIVSETDFVSVATVMPGFPDRELAWIDTEWLD